MNRWTNIAPSVTPRVLMLSLCMLVPLFGFGLLAEDVAEKQLFLFDGPSLQFMHLHPSTRLDRVMVISSRAGSALALVPSGFHHGPSRRVVEGGLRPFPPYPLHRHSR